MNPKIKTCTKLSKEYIYEQIFVVIYTITLLFLYQSKELLLLLLFLFFIITISYVIYKRRNWNNLSNWEKVTAEVINTKVVKWICFSTFKVRGNKNTVFKPETKYKYILNGEERISIQYARSLDELDCNFSYSESEAYKIVGKMKRDRNIDIFVNNKTGESVITLDVAKGYGIPYIAITIVEVMMLIFVHKLYMYN